MTRHLSSELVQQLHAVAIHVALDRDALLAGILPDFVASLAHRNSPAAQLLSDLHELNRTETLVDGTLPLHLWLENAVRLASPYRECQVFERALGAMRCLHTTVRPSSPASRASNLRQTHQVRVFVSASANDARFVKRLELHLRRLHRSGRMRLWHRGAARPGDHIQDTVASELASADMVIVILSEDYLADDETVAEVNSASRSEKLIVPILALPTSITRPPLADLKTLPANGVALGRCSDPEAAFAQIAVELERIVTRIATGSRPPGPM